VSTVTPAACPAGRANWGLATCVPCLLLVKSDRSGRGTFGPNNSGKTTVCVLPGSSHGCRSSERLDAGKGVCTPCGVNHVADATRLFCKPCQTGYVKDPPGVQVDATCKLSTPGPVTCQAGQILVNGICNTCPGGQVPNDAGSACDWCPTGFIKQPAALSGKVASQGSTGSEQDPAATCLTAVGKCRTGEVARNGFCESCPGGQVANAARDTCDWCPTGSIKQPAALSGKTGSQGSIGSEQDPFATCVTAVDKCRTGEVARNGFCESCPGGQVASAARDACDWCSVGTIIYPAALPDKTASQGSTGSEQDPDATCVSADCFCGCGDKAENGFCVNCGSFGTPNEARSSCVNCIDGTAALNGICQHTTCPASI
jgi:hypothetical protein